MSSVLIGAHRPADTVLHGLPAAVKLGSLLAAGPLIAVIRGWQSSLLALGLAVLLVALSRMPGRDLVRAVRGLLVLVLVLGGWLAHQEGWPRAVETVGDLLTLVLLATVVTTTTPVDAVLDVVERALEPASGLLRRTSGDRLRIDPGRVALAFSLVLRTIPTTIGLAEETRDAARARGLERDVRARLTPFAIRVVADAQATGEALHARGVGDD